MKEKDNKKQFKLQISTFTLSTHSIFSCSGIVVIHSPLEGFKNIPFSAASQMSYSLKFCYSDKLKLDQVVHKEESDVPRITWSRTGLPLPLSTTTVVFGSLQSSAKGCFSSGCIVSSVSWYWSPFLSTGTVRVPLKPCSAYHQREGKVLKITTKCSWFNISEALKINKRYWSIRIESFIQGFYTVKETQLWN